MGAKKRPQPRKVPSAAKPATPTGKAGAQATTKKRAKVLSKRKPASPRPSGPEPSDVYTIADREQLRALTDPLRVRILGAFTDADRTTKQVADLLGEKPTKLYHHVDLLARVGLLRATRTQQKRGTLEKYYRAVAHLFRADARLFAPDTGDAEGDDSPAAMVAGLFENTATELAGLLRAGCGTQVLEDEGVLSFCEVHATADEIATLRDQVMRWLDALQNTGSRTTSRKQTLSRYRLLLAFFPLDGEAPPATDD